MAHEFSQSFLLSFALLLLLCFFELFLFLLFFSLLPVIERTEGERKQRIGAKRGAHTVFFSSASSSSTSLPAFRLSRVPSHYLPHCRPEGHSHYHFCSFLVTLISRVFWG